MPSSTVARANSTAAALAALTALYGAVFYAVGHLGSHRPGRTDIWAVGEYGEMAHFDGATWTPHTAPVSASRTAESLARGEDAPTTAPPSKAAQAPLARPAAVGVRDLEARLSGPGCLGERRDPFSLDPPDLVAIRGGLPFPSADLAAYHAAVGPDLSAAAWRNQPGRR